MPSVRARKKNQLNFFEAQNGQFGARFLTQKSLPKKMYVAPFFHFCLLSQRNAANNFSLAAQTGGVGGNIYAAKLMCFFCPVIGDAKATRKLARLFRSDRGSIRSPPTYTRVSGHSVGQVCHGNQAPLHLLSIGNDLKGFFWSSSAVIWNKTPPSRKFQNPFYIPKKTETRHLKYKILVRVFSTIVWVLSRGTRISYLGLFLGRSFVGEM